MIETERLLLGRWQEEDREFIFELNSSPEVMKFFPSVLTREQSDEFFAKITDEISEKGWGLFAVKLKQTGELIGLVGLHEPQYEAPFMPCVEIGWRLHNRYWRKGYAAEAAKACLEFGFRELEIKEIVSFTSELNLPSIGVMEKIGMTRDLDGDFDHPKVPEDSPLLRHVLYRKRSL